VRREAVICASYVLSSQSNPDPLAVDLTQESRQAIVRAISPVLDLAAGTHLAYAIRTSFMSDGLKRDWITGTAEKLARLGKKTPVVAKKLTKEEKKFDRQKGLHTVTIGTIPERLLYTKDQFTVKAGKPVKLVLSNQDATEHNLLILDLGASVEEIGMAANEMAKSSEGEKKHYIPEDKRVLYATKLLKTGRTETLRFVAPKKPGKYPFVCTFPGHWTIMKGVMTVK
jgi:azurin